MAVTSTAYRVLYKKCMSVPHATLIRVEPVNLGVTLRDIYTNLADLSWVNRLPNASSAIMASFVARANNSLPKLHNALISGGSSSITKDAGQYVVSELARSSVVNEMDYLDIPLAELLRIQKTGNPGFDFYSENKQEIVLFGEAKYVGKVNAYGKALTQIDEFFNEGKDLLDIADLEKFCSESSLINAANGEKGLIAAFSATSIPNSDLVANIENNAYFKKLLKYKEVICVAVNI